MTMISKQKHTIGTAYAHESRLCIFQPTRRPKMIERRIETSWGKVRMKGKLGQAHADVLEAMRKYCDKCGTEPDGRTKLLIDPSKIRKESRQSSHSTFMNVIDDLLQVLVEIKEPVELACAGHLIDHIQTAVRSDGSQITKKNPLGGERVMWKVTLGKAACHLIENDLSFNYDVAKISQIEHGMSQAIARHVLTHSKSQQPNGGWIIDELIKTVSAETEMDSISMRHRRHEIKKDANMLKQLGISISDDFERLHRF